MPSLSRELRRLLETTIAGENGARRIAEAGAEESLRRLAVDKNEPHTALTFEERALRNQLRAHGRQLGDKRDLQRGTQSTLHLKQAVAYEHWHRLLFARFLAENNLLMHPEHGVPLSLDEVRGLSLGQGRDWLELAAEYAQRMLLREVFRSDDPALRVPLSPEKRQELEKQLNKLPREVFLADDSLGWVYQFWQRDAKEKIEAELQSGEKADADRLPAKTQLFTEDYMVLFLLENTLGAWWTARKGTSNLPGYKWTYLRLNPDGSPASGTYDGWPRSVRELKILDPCMGSGHFLTFALPILARMRESEEGLSPVEAITSVLKDNLFGLELDARCSQIAAFNLALTAWKMAGQYFVLPELHLACSGLGVNASLEDWKALAGTDERQRQLMGEIYELFRNGPVLGSLIDPQRTGMGLINVEIAQLLPAIAHAFESELGNEEYRELTIAAQGTLAAFRILISQFTLVATNVPYLGRGKQSAPLADYCASRHPDAKADLATCFVDRCLQFCTQGGSVALVTPQNWLFLSTYRNLRERLLKNEQWNFVVRLGFNAFQVMNWWAANTSVFSISKSEPLADQHFAGLDVSACKTPLEKAADLQTSTIEFPKQSAQLRNPGARVVTDIGSFEGAQLSEFASVAQGISPGDTTRFTHMFWELPKISAPWLPLQSSTESTMTFGGLSYVIVDPGDPAPREVPGFRLCGERAWGKRGVTIAKMSSMPAALYMGVPFDANTPVITVNSEADLPAVWCYISSPSFASEVRRLDQKLDAAVSVFDKVPFDLAKWQEVAHASYPAGLPTPRSSDPTQWIFDGHPSGADLPLQVAVARLVGYRWPRQTGYSFQDCPSVGSDGLEGLEAADGILPLSSVAGEATAANRLRDLLAAAYGNEWSAAKLARLVNDKGSLESWLRDCFFEEHCQVFHQSPFVWHVWDGLKDGFHALVNYHKLDRRNLEKLIFSYLGDWLSRQRQDLENGVEGADTRLAAGEHLQGELKKTLEGEAPYDVFARWKPLNLQAIGWDPDLNDGVRINIRPWITTAKLYKANRPGVLRVTPSIKYTKDRGKEPARDAAMFPWFAKSTDRVNDVHLSLDSKRRARGLS